MQLIFLYFYNTPILLTNKIIVKKIQQRNRWANIYLFQKTFFFLYLLSHWFFFFTIILLFYLLKKNRGII
jgi:hypothetical protein